MAVRLRAQQPSACHSVWQHDQQVATLHNDAADLYQCVFSTVGCVVIDYTISYVHHDIQPCLHAP